MCRRRTKSGFIPLGGLMLCVRAVTTGGFSIAVEACKLVRQEYANEISMQIMQ